jgi:hypothetical protein
MHFTANHTRQKNLLQVRQASVRGQPVPQHGGPNIRNETCVDAVVVSHGTWLRVWERNVIHSLKIDECCVMLQAFKNLREEVVANLAFGYAVGVSKNMHVCSLLQGLQARVPRQTLAHTTCAFEWHVKAAPTRTISYF